MFASSGAMVLWWLFSVHRWIFSRARNLNQCQPNPYMKYYYAGPDNKTAGPVTLDEIQSMIKSGTLKSDPMVVPEGSSDWKPLSAHTGQAPAGGPPPPPPLPNQAAIAAEKAKEASKDAFGAFKALAGNPVGGLAGSFAGLGAARALGVGIAFCVVCVVFLVSASYRSGIHPSGFGGFIKVVMFALVPVASLVAATVFARMVFGGQGTFNQDIFIAGAATLPFALVGLVTTIITSLNIFAGCMVFAISIAALMINAGMLRLTKLTERAATLAVPLIVTVTMTAGWLMYEELVKESVRSAISGFPGFQ
jgi:hypothetical protein